MEVNRSSDATAVGALTNNSVRVSPGSAVSPVPDCPYTLEPQQNACPDAVRAHVCSSPAETSSNICSAATGVGADVVPPPVPSRPAPPLPQQRATPSSRTPHV